MTSRSTWSETSAGYTRFPVVVPGRPKIERDGQGVDRESCDPKKLVSLASCWEIAVKAGLGKLRLGEPSGVYLTNALARTGIELLSISLAHATAVESLPSHHRDPFDRLLIGQSIIEAIPILSVDPAFDRYGVKCLW